MPLSDREVLLCTRYGLDSASLDSIDDSREYTASEAAALLRVDRSTVSRWKSNMEVVVIPRGLNSYFIQGAELKNFIFRNAKRRQSRSS